MPSFARTFNVDVLAKWNAGKPDNVVRALFDQWCLPGEVAAGKTMLRLGLRDGYLNFYVRGQSVAKLTCGRNGPHLSVHNAYVSGLRKPLAGSGTPPAQGYKSYDEAALADPATAALIPGWIDTADSYASAEKCFVDELIAANPGVIDLEMGLPASDLPGSERVAPRMDLVVAQRNGSEPLSIGFWEAKCANNPELRANAHNVPKVVDQLGKYVRWMGEPKRLEQVQSAYTTTGAKLLALHKLFRGGGSTPASVAIWEALAQLEAPVVAMQPGIVIGNDWPKAFRPDKATIASGRMAQCAASFARNGHAKKLRDVGIHVHEVGPDHGGPALPFLSGATVPA